jgi:hypothetical protein
MYRETNLIVLIKIHRHQYNKIFCRIYAIKYFKKIKVWIWYFKLRDITFAPRLLVNLSAFASFILVTRMFRAKAESIMVS